MSKPIFYSAMVAAVIVVLAGCARQQNLIPTAATYAKWRQHQIALQKINHFSLSGSVAYFSPRTRSYARFYLKQQNNKQYDLLLNSPLGTPLFTLQVRPLQATLRFSDGRLYQQKNASQLLQEVTGLPIPLATLHNWLIGASNRPASDRLNADGYLVSTLLQDINGNWNIRILGYDHSVYPALPNRIELTHQQDRIKLTVRQWTL